MDRNWKPATDLRPTSLRRVDSPLFRLLSLARSILTAATLGILIGCAHPGAEHATAAKRLEAFGTYEAAFSALEKAANLEPENREYQEGLARLRRVLHDKALRAAGEHHDLSPAQELAALKEANAWLPGEPNVERRTRDLESQIDQEVRRLVESAGEPPFTDLQRRARAAVLYTRAAWLRPSDAEINQLARDLRSSAVPDKLTFRMVCSATLERVCSSLRNDLGQRLALGISESSEDVLVVISGTTSKFSPAELEADVLVRVR